MFSPSTIADMSARATARAARAHRAPHVLFSADTAAQDWRKAPFLGRHCPPTWQPVSCDVSLPDKVRELSWQWADGDDLMFFVDTSGFGTSGEISLSVNQQRIVAGLLVQEAADIRQTWGVGLLEAGQFQAVLGVFRKLPRKAVKK